MENLLYTIKSRVGRRLIRLTLLVVASFPAVGLVLSAPTVAGQVVYYGDNDSPMSVSVVAVDSASEALDALSVPPPGYRSALPARTRLLTLREIPGGAVADFSAELIAGALDEAQSEAIYEQIRLTLLVHGIDGTIRVLADGRDLYTYLPLPNPIPAPPARIVPRVSGPHLAASGLTGRKISLSPGHGLKWGGSSWTTDRPIYCAPLAEEDYHCLELGIYLETYLLADGATLKTNRCTDKTYGNYVNGQPWWRMGPSYWLKNKGYPCSVYANSGDCNLGSGASESSDNIRSRGLAPNYDGVDIHVAIHTNGLAGDCFGASCPSGTATYFDSTSPHEPYATASQSLASKIQSSVISTIRNDYKDSTWSNRGVPDFAGGNYETRIPNCPAALIELAFHDTCQKDALYLEDNFFRSATMWAMYKGICDYFGTTPTYPFYSYEVVSHDLPSSMQVGEVRTVHITLLNRGVLWNTAKQFRLGAVGESDPFTTNNRVDVGGEVAPGQQMTFTFTLTAPLTPGSYSSDWQMLREGIQWFGPIIQKNIAVLNGPDTQRPGVPGKPTAIPIAHNQVDLSWIAAIDNVEVTGYKVWRNDALLATVPINSYSDTACVANTSYSYRISALDAANNESPRTQATTVITPLQLDFIIDNPDAVFSGDWALGNTATGRYLADYRFASAMPAGTLTATWTPTIQQTGSYDVFVWYSQGSNRSTQAPYTVQFAGGSIIVPVDQSALGGQWNLIASEKPMVAGTSSFVRLSNGTPEAAKVVIADAVRFVYSGPIGDSAGPSIDSVAAGPQLAAAGDLLSIAVEATDASGVASVSADGIALMKDIGNSWAGSIPAKPGLGAHSVQVQAVDTYANISNNSTETYTTGRILRTNNFALHNDGALVQSAPFCLFGTWGKVTVTGFDIFELDDGSGYPAHVVLTAHGLQSGDFVFARGVWNPLLKILTSQAGQAVKID